MSFTPVSFDELADFIASNTRIPRSDIRHDTTLLEDLKLDSKKGGKLIAGLCQKYEIGWHDDFFWRYLAHNEEYFSLDNRLRRLFGFGKRGEELLSRPAPTVASLLEALNNERLLIRNFKLGLPLSPLPPLLLTTLKQHRSPIFHIIVFLLNTLLWALSLYLIFYRVDIVTGVLLLLFSVPFVINKWVFFAPKFFATRHITQMDASEEGVVFQYAVGLSKEWHKTPLIPWGQITITAKRWYNVMELPEVGQFHIYHHLFPMMNLHYFFSTAFSLRCKKGADALAAGASR